MLALVVAPAGLAIASGVAAGAAPRPRSSARLYELSVEYWADYRHTSYGDELGAWVQTRMEARGTSYSARSTHPFPIRLTYRGRCRRAGCLSFRALLSGRLEHSGTGWEHECWTNVGTVGQTRCLTWGPGQTPPARMVWCMANKTGSGTSSVTGFVSGSGPPRASVLGIDLDPGVVDGTVRMESSCGAWSPWEYAVAQDLIMPPSQEHTTPQDLRRRFGRAFTIRYPDPPSALPDKPNRTAVASPGGLPPAWTDMYRFSWTLRFTPVPTR